MPYATNVGVRIHYEVEGSGGPLLLHVGFMGSIPDWYRTGYVAALRDHYQLVLLDPRGQGQSDKPHEPEAYGPEQRVGDVLAVLDALGVERAHFLGYSLGGGIGFFVGVQAPHRLRSLAAGGVHPLVAQYREGALATAAILRGQGAQGLIEQFERANGPLPPGVAEQWLTNDAEALAAEREAIAECPSLEAELPALRLPSLLFCGDRDAPHEGAKRAASLMPNATFVSLPGLNHAQVFQRSDLVIPHLRALHAQVEATAVDGA